MSAEFSELAKHGDVAIFGIGRELPFAMSAWGEKIGLGFPLLSDPTAVVAEVGWIYHIPQISSPVHVYDRPVIDLVIYNFS